MAKVLSGKDVVTSIGDDLRLRVQRCGDFGIPPALAVVRVGENPADLSYERGLCKRAESVGVAMRKFSLPHDASQADLEAVINQINEDGGIHGCLLFRPLPAYFDEASACNAIDPEKDVDGVTDTALACVYAGASERFAPSTADACLKFLDYFDIPVQGKRVAVLGRSLVIGRPVAMMLLARDATPVICHSKTEDIERISREADIVICAVGHACAFGPDFFREGQTVIDVGINVANGKLCGDVDYERVEPIVAAITPVPGGVGTVTTSVTLEHVVRAAEVVAGLGK